MYVTKLMGNVLTVASLHRMVEPAARELRSLPQELQQELKPLPGYVRVDKGRKAECGVLAIEQHVIWPAYMSSEPGAARHVVHITVPYIQRRLATSISP